MGYVFAVTGMLSIKGIVWVSILAIVEPPQQ